MSVDIQKVIRINPELFKLPTTNKTKKVYDKKIRVKTPKTVKNINPTILNHIRTKQNEMYNSIIENSANKGGTNVSGSSVSSSKEESEFESDFDKALHHLESITNKTKDEDSFKQMKQPSLNTSPITIQQPNYGCLKKGKLPTFRSWKKTLDEPSIMPAPNPLKPVEPFFPSSHSSFLNSPKNLSEIEQTKEQQIKSEKLKEMKKKVALGATPKTMKQKRTIKRKFNVGKSKFFSKIGVLISNRTLRNQTLQKTQLLKQTPIIEIKKELVKKGLIKVGSNAPNDVLRKLYESVSLINGDVHNHNLETILHNYINEK
jgi:hypothetical protein